ncbi:hypothetical protein PR048_002454 [Dryococelus australis]|uniref:Uncharacterized protein n=1 Tax=Dryococelus australis TaxID=614101 RepID=A0ABQ9IK78_9NEOP|nr:hypothetical protein PR048_002454 [Dryococelus australis]
MELMLSAIQRKLIYESHLERKIPHANSWQALHCERQVDIPTTVKMWQSYGTVGTPQSLYHLCDKVLNVQNVAKIKIYCQLCHEYEQAHDNFPKVVKMSTMKSAERTGAAVHCEELPFNDYTTKQPFPADILIIVAQNCHASPVIPEVVCQVGANEPET